MSDDTAVTRWAGPIGVEGEATGDGRFINPGALRWDDLPIPLRYVASDVGGHDGAVVVGNIETITRKPGGLLWATGVYDDSETAIEAARLVGKGMMNGISMDLDDVSFEVRVAQELVPDDDVTDDVVVLAQESDDGRVTVAKVASGDEMMVTTDGRVRSATQVAIPAFARAKINLATEADAVTAAAEETTADGDALFDAAVEQLRAVDQMEFLSPAYLAATDKAGDAFADAAIALEGTDPEKSAVAATAAAKLKRFASLPWDPDNVETRDVGETVDDNTGPIQAEDSVQASANRAAAVAQSTAISPITSDDVLIAAAAPVHPPEAWFDNPGLSGPTPMVIEKSGRVYGHLATWDVCHVAQPGGPGTCVVAPHSRRNYADFHLGATLTAEDTLIATGKITMNTGHAGPRLNATAAAAHYDNTGTAVCDVVVGEDEFGIWFSGGLRPEVTPEQIRALRAAPLSGDWRDSGGGLELKAALAVNVPGFPIPRPAGKLVASGERLAALTASGMLSHEQTPRTDAALSAADVDYLHRVIQRTRAEDAAKLAAEVNKVRNRERVAAFAAERKH